MTGQPDPARIARLERQLGIVAPADHDLFLTALLDGLATPPDEIMEPARPEERLYQRLDERESR